MSMWQCGRCGKEVEHGTQHEVVLMTPDNFYRKYVICGDCHNHLMAELAPLTLRADEG